jgi:tetratricopeptide (TPR) repeat protein
VNSRRWLALALAVAVTGCVSAPKTGPSNAPAFAAIDTPIVPKTLTVSTDIRQRHDAAWARLQAGDARTATREFTEILKASPAFYPAETGLGFVALAGRKYPEAIARFRAALARDARYVPAWRGLVDAQLGAQQTDEAIDALKRLLDLDKSQENDRARLELLELKQVQSLIEGGRRARDAKRYDEADRLLDRALTILPRSALVLRERALLEIAMGQLDAAEGHARQAVDADKTDATAYDVLALALEARGRLREAATAWSQAAAIDPAYRARADAARAKAASTLPAELRDLDNATSVTRAQLAALIGIRLDRVLARSTRNVPAVATDLRGHWAADSIVAVTQAGVMDVFANHTFQPASAVRRSDLAQVMTALLRLASAAQPDQLARWQSARPAFVDLGGSNVLYPAAALAVSAGAMTAPAGRFEPARAASGADVLAAIARIEQLDRGGK